MKKVKVTDLEDAIFHMTRMRPDIPLNFDNKWTVCWKKKGGYRFLGDKSRKWCIFWDHYDKSRNILFYLKSAPAKVTFTKPIPPKTNIYEEYNKYFVEAKTVTTYMLDKDIELKNYHTKGCTHLIIPIHNDKNELVSFQEIGPDGTKRFKKGYSLGDIYFYDIEGEKDKIYVCEGVATGASVHKITGNQVYCALSKGNIDSTANFLLNKYKTQDIICALDNDGPEKTHTTKITSNRLKCIVPEKKGDFNDFQNCYIEQYKLKTLKSPPTDKSKDKFIYRKLEYIYNALYSEIDLSTVEDKHNFLDQQQIFPTHNALLLSGATEAGKTAFCLVVLSKALKADFTVYIWEHSELNRKNRLNKWIRERELQKYVDGKKLNITSDKCQIIDAFKKNNIVLIDDTDSFLQIKKTIDRREVADTLEQINWIAQLAECTIILCHYMTKTSRGEKDIKLRSGGDMTWINKMRYAGIIDIGAESYSDDDNKKTEKEKSFLTLQKGYRPGAKESAWWLKDDFTIGEPMKPSEVSAVIREKQEGSDEFTGEIARVINESMDAQGKLKTKDFYAICNANFALKRGQSYRYLKKLPQYTTERIGEFPVFEEYIVRSKEKVI